MTSTAPGYAGYRRWSYSNAPMLSFILSVMVLPLVRTSKPNVVLFLADDMGYADLSSYGHPSQEEGPIDRLGQEGIRFTSAYAAHSLCTPSRAALLTGRLPVRYGFHASTEDKDSFGVLMPHSSGGLPHGEETVAEGLKRAGYTSGIVGKWHLGNNAYSHNDGYYLPHTQGFDYVGTILPFTLVGSCGEEPYYRSEPSRSRCFLYKNTTIVQQPIMLATLIDSLLNDALSFIHRNKDRPFFLYFSFPHVHNPMIHDSKFRNTSRRGLYGDMVNEMQWAIGEVMKTIRELNLDEQTLSIFASDHGPALELCNEGGTAGMFRAGKGTFYEGGIRVPLMARWPGQIKPGQVNHDAVSLMDIFPALLSLAGTSPSNQDQTIDGRDISSVFRGGDGHKHRTLFFHCDARLVAVRYRQYKVYYWTSPEVPSDHYDSYCDEGTPSLHLFLYAKACVGIEKHDPPIIYDLESDPAEKHRLSIGRLGRVMDEVTELVRRHLDGIGKVNVNLLGSELWHRSLIPCCNPPFCLCRKNGQNTKHKRTNK